MSCDKRQWSTRSLICWIAKQKDEEEISHSCVVGVLLNRSLQQKSYWVLGELASLWRILSPFGSLCPLLHAEEASASCLSISLGQTTACQWALSTCCSVQGWDTPVRCWTVISLQSWGGDSRLFCYCSASSTATLPGPYQDEQHGPGFPHSTFSLSCAGGWLFLLLQALRRDGPNKAMRVKKLWLLSLEGVKREAQEHGA